MITVRTLHKLYIDYLDKKINKLLADSDQAFDTRNNIQQLLEKNRSTIDLYLSVKYNKILECTSKSTINKIKIPTTSIYTNGREINFKAIKLYIEKYIQYNSIIHSNSRKIENIKKQIISFTIYNKIISKFNQKCIDAIIHKNWSMDFYKGMGQIFVRQVENHKKRIDWGVSTKNKQAIIDRGELPYLTADAENTPNYKGIKWIAYRPPIDFFIHWYIPANYRKRIPFINDYRFKPARGLNSFVSKLGEVKKDRDSAFKLYTRKHEWI
tara:strand:- start:9045 stop:9848 length:804 start_codon:yes stop_codon:yes gene_type:complete